MIWAWVAVGFLVLFGSLLAVAETSISRMSRVRAMALREEGRRNAELLERIEENPARYLNSIYLAVMLVQNGSAIMVAIIADRLYGSLGITLLSAGFTLLYFVIVEAMAKTFGILHSDRAALTLAPLVWFLGRALAWPTRALIGLANVLLPGKGLKQGPFVSEEDIRQMAEVGHEEGAIEEEEKEYIHAIFEFGDTVVREVMVPRPDMVMIDVNASLDDVLDLVIRHGYSRVPVYKDGPDEIVGVIYAKDVLRHLRNKRTDRTLADIARKPYFVPESKKVSDLLKDMQREKFHLAIVVDEFGSVAGLVTLEDLLEEIVGEIADEYDREEPNVEPAGANRYRVNARLPVDELNELLEVDLPNTEWDTVGGLMMGVLGRLPGQGEAVEVGNLRLVAERVQGRRIAKVLVERVNGEQAAVEAVD
jgi:CBS domain containing-hemolysin-like protein